MSNTLPLELAEDPFASRVIATTPNGTHAGNQCISTQKALIIGAGKLDSYVKMQNYRPVALTLLNRHFHCADHHLPVLTTMHRPAND